MSIRAVEPAETPAITVLKGARHTAADAGIDALERHRSEIYQRGRLLVRAVTIKTKLGDGAVIEVPAIVTVGLPMLGRMLGEAAVWQRYNAKGELMVINPPDDVVQQIAAMVGNWPFKPLTGVIATQTLRPDGSLLLLPGYDEATGLVLMTPPRLPPIPNAPTYDEALAALEEIEKLLAEFPFADPASKSVALSMILTAVLRAALTPAVPLHIATAPQAGTGKSYLQDIVAAIAMGERCPVIAYSMDPLETEKRLVSAAIAGYPLVAIDNVNDILTGDFLAQLTERPMLTVRPLGTSDSMRIPNSFCVFANGNNIAATADLVRRTIRCALDSNLENPESRLFHADPVKIVLGNRGLYIGAVLLIARAYLAAGSPDKCPALPSYEAWSDLVRSALVWLGRPDPVLSMDIARAEDPVRETRGALFTTWAAEISLDRGYTVPELIRLANETNENGELARPDFRALVFEIAGDQNGRSVNARKLGKYLTKNAKTIVRDFKLIRDDSDPSRLHWKLQKKVNVESDAF